MKERLHAIYQNVTKKRGLMRQVHKLFEEIGEFNKELMLFLVDAEDASVENLISEAGDVINMLMQIVIYFGGDEDLVNAERIKKMEREENRILKEMVESA